MSYEPIPARGAGANLFDQPSLFYLTNQKLIDEWAALADTVTANVDRWLRTFVRDDLAAASAERDLVLSVAKGPGRHFALVTHPADATFLHGKPVIGVGLIWNQVFPTDPTVFSGVRCSANSTGRAAAATFRTAGGDALMKVRGYQRRDTTWPIWRWIVAGQEWWTDLDAYRAQLVTDTLDLLDSVRGPLFAASQVKIDTADGGDTDDESDEEPVE